MIVRASCEKCTFLFSCGLSTIKRCFCTWVCLKKNSEKGEKDLLNSHSYVFITIVLLMGRQTVASCELSSGVFVRERKRLRPFVLRSCLNCFHQEYLQSCQ